MIIGRLVRFLLGLFLSVLLPDTVDQFAGLFRNVFLIAGGFVGISSSFSIRPDVFLFADEFVDVFQDFLHAGTFGFDFADTVFALEEVEQHDQTVNQLFLPLDRIAKLRRLAGQQFMDDPHLPNDSLLLTFAVRANQQFCAFRIGFTKLLGHLHQLFFKPVESTEHRLLTDLQGQFLLWRRLNFNRIILNESGRADPEQTHQPCEIQAQSSDT